MIFQKSALIVGLSNSVLLIILLFEGSSNSFKTLSICIAPLNMGATFVLIPLFKASKSGCSEVKFSSNVKR